MVDLGSEGFRKYGEEGGKKSRRRKVHGLTGS